MFNAETRDYYIIVLSGMIIITIIRTQVDDRRKGKQLEAEGNLNSQKVRDISSEKDDSESVIGDSHADKKDL